MRKVAFHPFSPFHAVVLLSNNVLLLTDVLSGTSEEFGLQNSLQVSVYVCVCAIKELTCYSSWWLEYGWLDGQEWFIVKPCSRSIIHPSLSTIP